MLIVPLSLNSEVPLYQQIYDYIKKEIESGKLAVATKLPSTRNLAISHQISRSTAAFAYNQLSSEGYIEAIPKSGYYVLDIGNLIILKAKPLPQKVRMKEQKNVVLYDFSPFALDMSEFPFSTWRKLNNQCLNDMNQGLFLLGDNQGDLSLREAIGRYLHSARGAVVEPSRIIIGAGADYLLQLLMQLIGRDVGIAMENPAYIRAYKVLKGLGYKIYPIPVNPDGINIEKLKKTDASVAYVTPTHQYPLGVVMPIKRRMELLKWAAEAEHRYIIEDDHDSEFRYKGKPIPSLQGIDESDRVIYLGTFSRAIAPAIRMGYMVLPEALAKKYQEEYSYYASTVSRIDQAIVYEFLNGGYFERHVNKMRKRYKAKHDILLKELKLFGNQIKITGENAGLHIVIELFLKMSEEELIRKAGEQGIKLYGLNKHYLTETKSKNPMVLLGFANLSEERLIAGVKAMHHCFLS